jgi:hypothetical protein
MDSGVSGIAEGKHSVTFSNLNLNESNGCMLSKEFHSKRFLFFKKPLRKNLLRRCQPPKRPEGRFGRSSQKASPV